MTQGACKENILALAHLLADFAPGLLVATQAYVDLRRRFSKTPQRFEPTGRALPFTPGQWRERKLAGPTTDLVIDGFPGSGNSFVSNSIRDAVVAPCAIESHFHYTAQLKRALRLGIPTLVIVREPVAACNSLKSKQPRLDDRLILARWIHYHAYVLRRLTTLEVFFFEDVVADLEHLRERSPAVARLTTAPLIGNSSYRRASAERRTKLDDQNLLNRLLLAVARRLFDRLVMRRP